MTTTTFADPEDRPRESYTFADGQTVPFRVTMPPMPHPVRLIATRHQKDQIAACVPAIVTRVYPGDDARFAAYVRELYCVHNQPAIVREKRDNGQIIYCPDCRRRGSLDLKAPDLASEAKERAAREPYRKAGDNG